MKGYVEIARGQRRGGSCVVLRPPSLHAFQVDLSLPREDPKPEAGRSGSPCPKQFSSYGMTPTLLIQSAQQYLQDSEPLPTAPLPASDCPKDRSTVPTATPTTTRATTTRSSILVGADRPGNLAESWDPAAHSVDLYLKSLESMSASLANLSCLYSDNWSHLRAAHVAKAASASVFLPAPTSSARGLLQRSVVLAAGASDCGRPSCPWPAPKRALQIPVVVKADSRISLPFTRAGTFAAPRGCRALSNSQNHQRPDAAFAYPSKGGHTFRGESSGRISHLRLRQLEPKSRTQPAFGQTA